MEGQKPSSGIFKSGSDSKSNTEVTSQTNYKKQLQKHWFKAKVVEGVWDCIDRRRPHPRDQEDKNLPSPVQYFIPHTLGLTL
uniref:Ovule protein n=1 Tax=Steinernema glaseri TaxID=37863 RepID=A0A1I8A1M3_9BILA